MITVSEEVQQASRAKSASGASNRSIVGDVQLVLVALWLGAALFLATTVAPGAFAVLPTSDLAGAVVGRALATLNVSGFVIGATLLLVSWFGRKSENATHNRIARRWGLIEVTSLLILAVTSGINVWIISARLATLRAQAGVAINRLAVGDPVRAEFGALHGASVLVLAAGMLAAIVAVVAIVRRRRATGFLNS